MRNTRNKGKSIKGIESEFIFSTGTAYADKAEYIEKNLIFKITAIEREAGRGFDGEDRWSLSVEPTDGRGPEIITFSCNEKRDRQLQAAKTHIEQHGPIANVRLHKSGNAYYLENGVRKAS